MQVLRSLFSHEKTSTLGAPAMHDPSSLSTLSGSCRPRPANVRQIRSTLAASRHRRAQHLLKLNVPQEGRFALNRVPFRHSTWRTDVLVYNYTPIVATVVFMITQKQYVASLDHYPEYYVAADPVPGSALRKL